MLGYCNLHLVIQSPAQTVHLKWEKTMNKDWLQVGFDPTTYHRSWLAWNCYSFHGNRTLFIWEIIVGRLILWVYNYTRWPHECLMRCKNCQLFPHLKMCISIEHLSVICLMVYEYMYIRVNLVCKYTYMKLDSVTVTTKYLKLFSSSFKASICAQRIGDITRGPFGCSILWNGGTK